MVNNFNVIYDTNKEINSDEDTEYKAFGWRSWAIIAIPQEIIGSCEINDKA